MDTDIPAVLRALSLFTQRNFLVDPRVKGKLTLVSDRPVDSNQALSMPTARCACRASPSSMWTA